MSMRIKMMVDHVRKIKNYKSEDSSRIKRYLQLKFKCSPYMAKQTIKILSDEQ